ncbi:hypothetical protein PT282_07115 [Bifidobacterium sp. ESL0763]|uniref:DUF6541 family protein n=1 Tax=Bifidobacterium sp. ESL0763 TaxID=2983227 RepID=UPI0023F94680|nr:DUF6541 family protein [Bifidobacterium sp. ESL0763]MDF7664426.1 hypothetical protein [Bifidobacterium sp. ESL0763]
MVKRIWNRGWRAWALPLSAVAGVLAAFGIVVAWFPNGAGAWSLPLQQIDAPAHYYFIRKILREGVGAALRLWPNDAYYPPMFHLIAAGLIAAGRLIGVNVSIYAAFNIVWLATSGLVWPAGMSLLASYWTRQVDGRAARLGAADASGSGHDEASPKALSARPFSCCMMVIVPVLAVSSASHPFQMLASGPLISFGLATTLLPYWLYATLRLFDAMASRRHVVRWLAATALLGLLCIFAHPRIAFTWLLLMAPFMLMRLPWKLIVAALGAVVACAVAFFFYMTGHYHSTRYFDPSSWFHTYKPNRTVPEALRVFVTDNVSGPAGAFMAVVVILALLVALAAVVRPRLVVGTRRHGEAAAGSDSAVADSGTATNTDADSGSGSVADSEPVPAASADSNAVATVAGRPTDPERAVRRDAIALILDFLLVGLVYVCSTSLTGWFPNIVAAAWYRAETRPLTMIPFAIVPLLVFAACLVARACPNLKSGLKTMSQTKATALPRLAGKVVAGVVLAALALACQFGNTARVELRDDIARNMTLTGKPYDEQLTAVKYQVLRQSVAITGTDALIISDPLNGSMYGSAAFGANMLFPVYNPMHEKHGAIFGQTEAAFGSGDPRQLTATTCPVDGGVPKYFLAMGPQAPSLKMFTFRQQYDVFHRQDLIDAYERQGTLVKVRDFGSLAPYAKGWALYRIDCGRA